MCQGTSVVPGGATGLLRSRLDHSGWPGHEGMPFLNPRQGKRLVWEAGPYEPGQHV